MPQENAVTENGLKATHASGIVPIFDGVNMSVNDFAYQLQIITSRLKTNEESAFLLLIRSRLAGDALDHYQRNFGEYNKINDLIDDFKTRFQDSRSILHWIEDIKKEVQKSKEPVREFGSRIESKLKTAVISIKNNNILSAAKKEMQLNLLQETARLQFLRGLKNDLEIRVRMNVPENLQVAITTAIKIEHEYLETVQMKRELQKNSLLTCVIHGEGRHSSEECHTLALKLADTSNSLPRRNNYNNNPVNFSNQHRSYFNQNPNTPQHRNDFPQFQKQQTNGNFIYRNNPQRQNQFVPNGLSQNRPYPNQFYQNQNRSYQSQSYQNQPYQNQPYPDP